METQQEKVVVARIVFTLYRTPAGRITLIYILSDGIKDGNFHEHLEDQVDQSDQSDQSDQFQLHFSVAVKFCLITTRLEAELHSPCWL